MTEFTTDPEGPAGDADRAPWTVAWWIGLGFVVGTLILASLPHDPTADLKSIVAPADLVSRRPQLQQPPAPDELRIVVVGASLSSGFPYDPAVSYASLMQVGLRAVLTRPVVCVPVAQPSLDGTHLAELVDDVLPTRPNVVCFTVGYNELASRLFASKPVAPEGPLERLADWSTRSRTWFRARLQSGAVGEGEALDALGEIVKRLNDARPARPLVPALPISVADREVFAERLRRKVTGVAERVAAAGATLVVCQSPFDVAGSWPCGQVELAPEVDAAVLDSWLWRHGFAQPVTEARALALRGDHPQRGDVWHLFAETRLAALTPAASAADLEEVDHAYRKARDLDPAPLHPVGETREALRLAADQLGVLHVDLDEALRLDGQPWPSASWFLDPAHVTPEGHARLAGHLVESMAEAGVLGPLPEGWRAAFDAAVAERIAATVTPAERAEARGSMTRKRAIVHMMFGNLRDAIPLLITGLEELGVEEMAPTDPLFVEWGWRLVQCTVGASGRLDEVMAGDAESRATIGLRLLGRLHAAFVAGTVPAFVHSVRSGEPL